MIIIISAGLHVREQQIIISAHTRTLLRARSHTFIVINYTPRQTSIPPDIAIPRAAVRNYYHLTRVSTYSVITRKYMCDSLITVVTRPRYE